MILTEQGKRALNLKGVQLEETPDRSVDSAQLEENEKLIKSFKENQIKKEAEKLLALLPQGEGSGLNADLLDGLHAREIIEKAGPQLAKGPTFGGGGSGLTQHGNEFHTPDMEEYGQIKGKTVDDAAIADGKVLTYDLASDNIKYAVAGGVGDMTKAVYDPDTDNVVESADNADTLDGIHAVAIQFKTGSLHAAADHQNGGALEIKLDDFKAPDNNTDLDVTITAHGLCPIAPNDATKFLRGDATWGASVGDTDRTATKVVGFTAEADYICDGVADEVQINLAIAAVVALGGGDVCLQRGTYVLAASITMGTLVWLHGVGFSTILQHPASGGFDMISATTKNKMIISDAFLEGNAKATCGIYFSGCTYSIIQRVYVNHSNDEGINLASSSHYNKVLGCIVTNCHDQGIFLESGSYNTAQQNYVYSNNYGIVQWGSYGVIANNIVCNSLRDAISIAAADNVLNGNIAYYNAVTAAGNDFYLGASRIVASGNYGISNVRSSSFSVAATGCSIVNNMAYDPAQSGFVIGANDVNVTGCTAINTKYHGIYADSVLRVTIVGNHIDSPDSASANTYHGIYLIDSSDCVIVGNVVTNSLARNVASGIVLSRNVGVSNNNVIHSNTVRGYDAGISIASSFCSYTSAKNNMLANNTACFADSGTDTKLASVIVPFVSGYDIQQSGILVDGEEDYADTWTMLPVEVQQVVRAKVYARSAATETHAMEADFVIYGAADNEAYTTNNGSAASLASTSTNFAADDVIYWTITAAGLLTMLGKDSIQARVDGAAADGDNCATNAYFRTLEIEYV
jgi:parallel beta-helix repeat protein